MIFDGRGFAEKFIKRLSDEAIKFEAKNGRKPKLVAVLDPKNLAGAKYVEQKKKFGERIGVELLVVGDWSLVDKEADGIMIQLPYPNSTELIKLIPPEKDVDGLRQDSPFVPATVRAVIAVLSAKYKVLRGKKMVVVGSKGEVGRRLEKELRIMNYELWAMDKDDFDFAKLKQADVVISCTGQAGLIKPEMVKDGVVCIDVGFPKGDFDPEVAKKASFFTPVPGGVGPVTVAMLFKNLVDRLKLRDDRRF